MSDREFAISELGRVDDVFFLFGMIYIVILSCCVGIVMISFALNVRPIHIDEPGVFAGPGTVSSYATGPALTVAGRGAVNV
jgi:hypothetical protein